MGELIIAIAIWCSVPVNKTSGPAGDLSGSKRILAEVQACRDRLLLCHATKEKVERTCFDKEKL